MKKEPSQTDSQRSSSTEEQKHEFAENAAGDELPKKSWLRRLNPFHRSTSPPVPAIDAGLVPDLNANWWSRLTWGWMAPLMMVISILNELMVGWISTTLAKGRSMAL
jgi:lipopolysaccharide export LptBFGC system permease protein LptF